MTQPLVPIGNHKEKDLRLIRTKLKAIIENIDSKAKDVTDASKLLARMHKALQPDKVVEKISPEEKKAQEELTDKDKDVIKEALGFK